MNSLVKVNISLQTLVPTAAGSMIGFVEMTTFQADSEWQYLGLLNVIKLRQQSGTPFPVREIERNQFLSFLPLEKVIESLVVGYHMMSLSLLTLHGGDIQSLKLSVNTSSMTSKITQLETFQSSRRECSLEITSNQA